MTESQKHALGAIAVILFLLGLVAVDGMISRMKAAEPVRGIASAYPQTAGFEGQATVALPSSLGGRYDGSIYAYATVCADRCARLPAVDWCECVVPDSPEPVRIIDLSHAAWQQVSDEPFGLITVTVEVEPFLPDTAAMP